MAIEPSHQFSQPNPPARTPVVRLTRSIVASVSVAAISFAIGAYVFRPPSGDFHASATPVSLSVGRVALVDSSRGLIPAASPQGAAFGFADLVQHVAPAVVMVMADRLPSTNSLDQLENLPPELRDFLNPFGGSRGGQPQAFGSRAMGSGFIIDPAGFIVTNNHVIDGAEKISIKLPDGRELPAKIIGTDATTDVALLKTDGARNLSAVAFSDDRNLRVGDWVIAVGTPFGLGGTVTAGIVSSIGRDIGDGPYTDYIQIDAPINRGNSGGPTFDLSGRVVGMNSAIVSPSGGSVGIGFAIPATTIQATVEQLKAHGSVTRGWLGIEIQTLTPELASGLGAANVKGALVARVVERSPAAAAGFLPGDVITKLNAIPIEASRDLSRYVADLHVGDKVQFTVLRNGSLRTLNVTIGKREETRPGANRPPIPESPFVTGSALGLRLSALTPEMRDRYGIDNTVGGVVVIAVDPDSEATRQGLHEGDVILSVGNASVHAPSDVAAKVKDAQNARRDNVVLLVAGQQGQHFVTLKVGKG